MDLFVFQLFFDPCPKACLPAGRGEKLKKSTCSLLRLCVAASAKQGRDLGQKQVDF